MKKPSRVRRKLCLDDEVKQDDGEAQTGVLEETFVFGLKPKKRQPRRKLEDEIATVTLKGTTKKAPAKGRKATKAKQQTEDGHVCTPLEIVLHEENVDGERVSGPPKQTLKKALAKGKKGTKAKQQTEDEHMSSLAAEPSAEAVVPEESEEKASNLEASEQVPIKAPTKGKKATKAKQQTESGRVSRPTTEPPTESVVPERKITAGRKKAVTKDLVAIVLTEPNTPEEAATINKAEPGLGDSGNPPSLAKTLNDETADSKSKPPKGKSATKRAHKRSIDEVMSSDMPEETTKRPRRQAAISANQKVTLSYEEDLVSVDKLRRAPDVGVQLRRSKKANTCEASASPQTMRLVSTTPQTLSGEVDRLSCSPLLTDEISQKAAVKSAEACDHKKEEQLEVIDSQKTAHVSLSEDADQMPDEELSSNLPKIPARRGRKPKAKAAEATPEELPCMDKVPAKRGRKLRVKAAEADSEAPLLSEEKLPAKRGRKPGVKATKTTPETTHVVSPNAITAIQKAVPTAVGPQESIHKAMDQSVRFTEQSALVAEQEPCNHHVQEQPKKTRRALADFDCNIVRNTVTAESKKLNEPTNPSASPQAKTQSKSRGTRTKPPVIPNDSGRHSKAQPAQHRDLPTDNNKPFRGTPTSSRKRHVISAEEDLDWLFEKPETKRSQPIRHPAMPTSKTRRKDADQNAKDMDLDDLLASIAGFSGKLLTGERGRAAAS
jgi:hypothetical protein